ncbi:MAG: hypothetical protein KZQ76_09045 [Candidatus Thiodiazotropha sp. (ex Epidulcina cf. delphinae)]|nr:hypothetical protein [Candidatus Thiodiazotropha sp. (ex Epidulcina cf. delphinae)]
MKKTFVYITVIVLVVVSVTYSIEYADYSNNKISLSDGEIKHPELGIISLLKSEPVFIPSKDNAVQDSASDFDDIDSDAEINNIFVGKQEADKLPNMPYDIKEKALLEIESTSFQQRDLTDMGFSSEGAEKLASNDPKNNLISIEDMPKELQDAVRRELEKSKANGYDDVSDRSADEITGVMNYIVSTSASIPNLRFSLSNIPKAITQNYSYIGYTFPGVTYNESVSSYGTVRRVYQRLDSSHLLIVQERGLDNGTKSNLTKEFINTEVNGYPAIYAIKKSPNGNAYAMLDWNIPSYSYVFYFVGPLKNSRNMLGFMGAEISKVNADKNDTSQENNSDAPIKSGRPSF